MIDQCGKRFGAPPDSNQIRAPRLASMAQPHKGDRDLMVTRPPRDTAILVRERALAAGVSISEYIAAALSRDVSNPVPAIRPKAQELPMTG
ncbi:hypothetical protein AESSP_02678 [Aestuariimicrobium sp. T2.26MG-19.2B]|nr:hypothetical protein AESSP_02678 [Aestuariimicrobium sp. T2.26MG-19.2B]